MSSFVFDIPKHHKSIIKVIGVGGGGSNAVNHMYNQGIHGVEFVICNTDVQALQSSPVPNKLQIGVTLTEGLGAGANPEIGRNAAIENKEQIRELLSNGTKMIFITAGMGGGTGTGAAPIIAKIARDMDILTVGIVTSPFKFEGFKKTSIASDGIDELKENCDTVLVILNEKLREIYGNLPVTKAFAEADNVLTTAAKGIAEIITVSGYVNVDFEDVKTVMKNSGAAVMGSATVAGEQRAIKAAENAINSPLLNNTDIHGAKKILLSITSGDQAELQMDELSQITDYIQQRAGDDAEVIFGHGIDPTLGESLNVTVIATGFGDHGSPSQKTEKRKVYDLERNRQIKIFDHEVIPAKPKTIEPVPFAKKQEDKKTETPVPEIVPVKKQEEEAPQKQIVFNLHDNSIQQPETKKEEPVKKNVPVDTYKSEDKKTILLKQARERSEKLQNYKNQNMSEDEFKDRWNKPAYERRNVKLQDTPHSSEHGISRYNLNDDNIILGNNKFLHDNVD